MAAKYWIKLYHEILDDPKMGRLNDRLWRRVIECFLFAGAEDDDGYLPALDDMAWKLRTNPELLEAEMNELASIGILDRRDSQWYVVNFSDRQGPSSAAIRMRELRKRKRKVAKEKENKNQIQKEDTDTYRAVTPVTERNEHVTLPSHLATRDMMNSWIEWITYHEERGKPLPNATAYKQFKLIDEIGISRAIAAIEHSITNGYVGLVEPRASVNGKKSDDTMDRLKARYEEIGDE